MRCIYKDVHWNLLLQSLNCKLLHADVMRNPVIASNMEGEVHGVVHVLATYALIFQRNCFQDALYVETAQETLSSL